MAGVSIVGEEERWGIHQEPTASPPDPDPTVLQPKLSGGVFALRPATLTPFSFRSGTESAQKSSQGLGHLDEPSRPTTLTETDFPEAFESCIVTYS